MLCSNAKLQRIMVGVLSAVVLLIACFSLLPIDTWAEEYTEGDYIYTTYDGQATIMDYIGPGGNVVIPATLGGYPVTTIFDKSFRTPTIKSLIIPEGVFRIGSCAFAGCTGLTAVTIPNSVFSIESYAFDGCSGITSVTIPEGVTEIGFGAFANCTSLTGIWVDENNPNYSNSHDGILLDKKQTKILQFPGGYSGTYIIPDSITSIECAAFSGCVGLTAVVIPNSITVIAQSVFRDCAGLVSVTIPNSVKSIGDYAFNGCAGLTSIDIPNGVSGIGYSAFSDCGKLSSVCIPDGVSKIDDSVFSRCTSLEMITIPASVTWVGSYAFDNCTGLRDVYYEGTVAQWELVGIYERNEPLINAQIHYGHVHDYTLITPVTELPTCVLPGFVEYTCAFGETYREVLPAMGHQTGINLVTIAPTCTEQGYTLSTCSRCGELAETEYIAALGHSFCGKESIVEPTCTEQGYTIVQCVRCEETEVQRLIDAIGHSMIVIPAVPPSCTKQGLTAGTACERCGLVGIVQKPTAPLGHTMQDGICIVCSTDLTGDGCVTDADAVYLLRHTLFPEEYPIVGNGDVNNDGTVTDADAVYLLRYTLFPEEYPLYPQKEEV